MELGFTKSDIGECVLYRGSVMYTLYKYDSINTGLKQEELDTVVKDTKKVNLEVTVEGNLEDFFGVNIDRREDDIIHLTQPHLLEQIVKELIQENPKTPSKPTPDQPSKILNPQNQSEDSDKSFHYIPVVGKLNYL